MKTHLVNRKRGAAIMTAVMFFVVITLTMAIGLSSPVVREFKTSRDFEKSKGAYYLSEAGSEDVIYRLKKGVGVNAQEVLSLGGNTATTTTTDVSAAEKFIVSVGDILTNTRRVNSTLTTTSGASFSYGVQAGDGGVVMQGSAAINGNLFSNGPITGAGNLITGSVISAGKTTGGTGSITNIHSDGSMYANDILNSVIGGTPYCVNISGSSPNTCDALPAQTPGTMPITQEQITQWEADAEAGGTIVCGSTNYTITGVMNLGPVKIAGPGGSECNLVMNSNADVTLLGPIWVVGDIILKSSASSGSARMTISPTLYGKSVVIIADNPADRLNSSTITIERNVAFIGSGPSSYIELLGQNDGASRTPPQNTEAIEVEGSVSGELLVYAGLGDIIIKDQAALKQVTGYKITVKDSAVISYATGLANTVFASGPGGAWVISDWKEGQ